MYKHEKKGWKADYAFDRTYSPRPFTQHAHLILPPPPFPKSSPTPSSVHPLSNHTPSDMPPSSNASSSSSGSSSDAARKSLFTPDELVQINESLAGKSPQEILTWAIDTLPQGALWQTTAFGLSVPCFLSFLPSRSCGAPPLTPLPLAMIVCVYRTGLASLAMISDISLSRDETHLVPLIFLDTLYHFPSTLDLAERASQRYLADLHTFKPIAKDGKTELEDAKAFEDVYGEKLWEKEEDMYDYLVKVCPSVLPLVRPDVQDADRIHVMVGCRLSQTTERTLS
jgi:3'-phosphoadenosine 5'-phosphosulfate sulfotransferase (PAPS reductase)/FAD synthetase